MGNHAMITLSEILYIIEETRKFMESVPLKIFLIIAENNPYIHYTQHNSIILDVNCL